MSAQEQNRSVWTRLDNCPISPARNPGVDTLGRQGMLFSSRVWLDPWLTAFGGAECGYWTPRDAEVDLKIAYTIETVKIGPLALRIGKAAANCHTPRYDVSGHVAPSMLQLRDMMVDLGVSALSFPYLAPTSLLLKSTESRSTEASWLRSPCEDAPFINCRGDWSTYLDSRGSTRQMSWRKYEKRMLRSGGCFEVLSSWEDISSSLPEVLHVEASGWKGRSGSSISQDPTTRRFYEDVCNRLANLGKLRLFLIRCHGRIIAFQIATLDLGVLTGLKASYLEEFAKESPGQVLQLWITRWAFESSQVHLYDLLGPPSEYKMRFATGLDPLETLLVFSRTLGGTVARLRWSVAPRIKRLVRGFIKV